jgi:hypothetical protein
MTCAQCIHFLARGHPLAKSKPTEQRFECDIGICRRRAPRVIWDSDENDILSVFPAVHRDQRCGEFEAEFAVC